VGKYYQVRQSNAHTWVEAYLRPEDAVPPHVAAGLDISKGAWLTLDPTAPVATAAEEIVDQGRDSQSLSQMLSSIYDYAWVLWMKYVVELSPESQQEGIYKPLSALWQVIREGFFQPEAWLSLWESLTGWFRQNWFSWQGALAGSALCLVLVGVYRLLRWLVLRPLWRHVVEPTARAVLARSPAHEFHRRLEKALGQLGLLRSPGQTALEFAVLADAHLRESAATERFAPLPRQVVEALYRVRFGGRSLDVAETEAVEQALDELEHGLTGPK
jgi:hypothetical protein